MSEPEPERPERRAGGWPPIRTAAVLVLLACAIGLAISLVQAWRRGRGYAEACKIRCKCNLMSLAQATQTWSLQYGNKGEFYPPSLRALYEDGVVEGTKAFVCPSSETEVRDGQFVSDYQCILDFVEGTVPTALVCDSTTPFAWDNTASRHGGVCVVYFDQHVDFIEGDDALEKVYGKVYKCLREYHEAKAEKESWEP